jgi:signal transduction histidine kinase/ABC-type uncharacterized transport system substrate-binding protein
VRTLLPVLSAFALAGLMAGASNSLAQDRPTRTVLIVQFGSEDSSNTAASRAAIREALLSRTAGAVDVFSEFLRSDRLPPEAAALTLSAYIQEKYQHRHIDLVIADNTIALQFVLRHRDALFADAPVVFAAVAPPDAGIREAGPGITGLVFGSGFRQTVELALTLHPHATRVFVVAEARDEVLTRRYQDLVGSRLRDLPRGVDVTFSNAPDLPQLIASVRALPADSVVLYIEYLRGDVDRDLVTAVAQRVLALESPVPIYVVTDQFVGSGVVGGIVRVAGAHGTRLGEMASAVLSGTSARDIPIEEAPLVPIFDWRAVQRWGLDPSRLPPASDIRFKPPSAWESYRGYIVGALSVTAVQTALILGLLAQRRRRRRAEAHLRSNEAALRTSYEHIRQLAGGLISAQEAARTRIARDLHDDVCQELAGVSMIVGDLKGRHGDIQDIQAQEVLSTLEHRTRGLVDGVRRLSHDLHPAMLRHVGLAAALEAHCIEIEQRYDAQVTFSANSDLRQVPGDVAICLFRIAQEALRNAATHGEARRVAVCIAAADTSIELTVVDDGKGFDLADARQRGAGLGLVSMEERARLAAGEIHIDTGHGQGTTVRVHIAADSSTVSERDVSVSSGARP